MGRAGLEPATPKELFYRQPAYPICIPTHYILYLREVGNVRLGLLPSVPNGVCKPLHLIPNKIKMFSF